ncbi:MAG: cation transporter [Polyangiaceae bacterium]|nr:cation transporter [Polyangiaceae bacterium]
MLAALAASSCCIGPLVLAALGIGGAGALAALLAYRPYILVATAALLGFGFYLTYRRPRAVQGDTCGCERPGTGRAGKVGLWVATLLVALFATAPTIIACVSDARSKPVAAAGVRTETAVISVHGADCEACASNIKTALSEVGGFHDLELDLASQTVRVTYEPAPGRVDAYVAALNDIGYEASLPKTSKTQP